MARKAKTELNYLEQCGIALNNAANHTEISALLDPTGYNAAKIKEGKALLDQAMAAYRENQQKETEKSNAHTTFSKQKKQLQAQYNAHRKRAKALFYEDIQTKRTLGLDQNLPKAHTAWLEEVTRFYTQALASEGVKTKLATLGVTADHLTAAQTHIAPLKAAYRAYAEKQGEAQAATKTKNRAIDQVENFMKPFYRIAAIVLDKEPQLMEALGKMVRS